MCRGVSLLAGVCGQTEATSKNVSAQNHLVLVNVSTVVQHAVQVETYNFHSHKEDCHVNYEQNDPWLTYAQQDKHTDSATLSSRDNICNVISFTMMHSGTVYWVASLHIYMYSITYHEGCVIRIAMYHSTTLCSVNIPYLIYSNCDVQTAFAPSYLE